MNPCKLLAGTILSISFAIGIPDLCHAQTAHHVLKSTSPGIALGSFEPILALTRSGSLT